MGRLVNKPIVVCIVVLFCVTLAGSWAQIGTKYLDGRLKTVVTPSVDHNKSNGEADSNKINPSNFHSNFCPTCEKCPAGYDDGRNSYPNKNSNADF